MTSALRSSAATEQRVHEASGWRLASAKYSCRRSERNLWARSTATTVALLSFLLTLLASSFNSKTRLEAENAVLRRQLIISRRKVRGRVHFTNGDRLFLVQLYRWFPSVLKTITNDLRTHRSFDKDAPFSRPVQRTGRIRSHALVGGLHRCYMRVCVFGTHNRSASASSRLRAYFRQLYFLRAMPHVPVNDEPGFSLIRASPVRNAFGGQVIGSTARLRRRTSGSGSPLKSIK